MPDIFLYSGELTPSDIILSDPTVQRSGGVTYYGILKRWNGSSWVKEPIEYYNGASFVPKPLKRWDGLVWAEIDTTGI